MVHIIKNKRLEVTSEQINEKTTKHRMYIDGQCLRFSNWIDRMLVSDELILEFNQALINSAFDSFFWEVKPISIKSINQDFEFVIVNSEALKKISPNSSHFEKYFTKNDTVVNFSNLSGDAELIVPTPMSSTTKYAHIADFVRTAKQHQRLDFWKKVVKTYSNHIGNETKWLSTSGLGVAWLHVRIDSKPKYYQHLEYKLIQ